MASINDFFGGGGGGGFNIPSVPKLPGFEIGIPIKPGGGGDSGSTGTGSGGQNATSASTLGNALSFFYCIFNPADPSCLIRLLFIILGLICIIGAIYLYKPVNEVVNSTALGAVAGGSAGAISSGASKVVETASTAKKAVAAPVERAGKGIKRGSKAWFSGGGKNYD